MSDATTHLLLPHTQAFERFSKEYPSSDVHSPSLSRIYAELAVALWKMTKKEEAANTALRAIHLDKQNQDAQFLLREIRQSNYQNAKHMRIILHGKWHEPFEGEKEPHGFFTTYDVVADDETEALAFIKEFEPEEIRETLRIEEVKITKSKNQLKGVHRAAGYCFYSEKK